MSVPHPRPPRSRLALATLAVLALLGALIGVPAAPASAKVPDRWGFAYNDQLIPPANYVMPPYRQWGSWKTVAPAEWATVTRFGTGNYQVKFPRLAGRGIAHVTAVNTGPISCQLVDWSPGGVDEYVRIRCVAPSGIQRDSAFTVMFSESSGVGGGPYGYVWGKELGGIADSFNSTGGANLVSFGGAGLYKVWLPGLGVGGYDGNIQVTAVNRTLPARCKVARWAPRTDGQAVYVQCHDMSGAGLNSDFTLTYHHKVGVYGEGYPPKQFGYLWDTLTPAPTASFNSQGGVNSVVSAGDGLRMARFPLVGADESHVQVTAEGPGAAFCNLLAPWVIYGSEVFVRDVACYTQWGGRSNEHSFVTYTSRL